MKKLLFSILVLGAMASCLMAISNASISADSQIRWNGVVTAGSVITQGGNITPVNISSVQLTSKWAAFYGNISGSIILGDTSSITNVVYKWTYTTSAGGKVCVSNNTAQTFASPINATTALIDSNCGTTGAPDNATNTFQVICPSLTLSTGSLTDFLASKIQGSSGFYTCAATTAGATASSDHVFCTSINSTGTNYLGASNHYELIVPAPTTITYSFYAELT